MYAMPDITRGICVGGQVDNERRSERKSKENQEIVHLIDYNKGK